MLCSSQTITKSSTGWVLALVCCGYFFSAHTTQPHQPHTMHWSTVMEVKQGVWMSAQNQETIYDECGDCICGMLLHGCCPVTSQQHGGACSWFYAWGAVRANLGLLVFPSCSGDEKNIFHVILFRWQPSKFDLWQCPQRCSACMYVVNLLTYISTYIHTYICSDCCLMHAVCVRTLLCRMSMGLCWWWTETSTFSLPLKTCLSSWDHSRYVGSLPCAWGTQLCMHWGKRMEACDMQAESVVLQGRSVRARWSVFHMLVCVWLITSFTVNYIFYS